MTRQDVTDRCCEVLQGGITGISGQLGGLIHQIAMSDYKAGLDSTRCQVKLGEKNRKFDFGKILRHKV